MSPLVALIIGKLLDYLSDHADDIIEIIRAQFESAKSPEVNRALEDFSAEPNEDTLAAVHNALEEKGEDVGKLASLVLNQATA